MVSTNAIQRKISSPTNAINLISKRLLFASNILWFQVKQYEYNLLKCKKSRGKANICVFTHTRVEVLLFGICNVDIFMHCICINHTCI